MWKFFTRLPFPAKNNTRAARNWAYTKPFDFIRKILAKSSFRLNFFHPEFRREFLHQELKDVRQYILICRLYSRTFQMNWRILLCFRYLEQKKTISIGPKIVFDFINFVRRQRVYVYFKLFSDICINRAVNPPGYLVIMLHTFCYFSFIFWQWF